MRGDGAVRGECSAEGGAGRTVFGAGGAARGGGSAQGAGAGPRGGVVHRDIKPNNLLFTADDVPKVADFGLAWVREDPASLTQTGAVLGSIPFMSPEQRRGEPAGPASDLYSLAATLLFLATGAVPGDLYVEATWERASRVGYPLVRVLGLAGRLDPQERFGSAKEMGEPSGAEGWRWRGGGRSGPSTR